MAGFEDPRIREIRIMGGCVCIEVHNSSDIDGFRHFAYEKGCLLYTSIDPLYLCIFAAYGFDGLGYGNSRCGGHQHRLAQIEGRLNDDAEVYAALGGEKAPSQSAAASRLLQSHDYGSVLRIFQRDAFCLRVGGIKGVVYEYFIASVLRWQQCSKAVFSDAAVALDQHVSAVGHGFYDVAFFPQRFDGLPYGGAGYVQAV